LLHQYINDDFPKSALLIIKRCFDGALINSKDYYGEVPLTKAAQLGQHSVLKALIDHPFIEVDMRAVSPKKLSNNPINMTVNIIVTIIHILLQLDAKVRAILSYWQR